ncbi:MAG TPA: hypothetical protein PLS49_03505 [Candidatus Woesebacteria bacterium]|nr:hypothetical protein [Candidatus Woesebacteria bacterium]
MALTRNDIQILKEIFQPEFDKIHERFDRLQKDIDRRFDKNDKAHDRIVNDIIAELYDLYTPRDDFNILEKRVTKVESRIN